MQENSPVKMAGKLIRGIDVSLPSRIKYLIDDNSLFNEIGKLPLY